MNPADWPARLLNDYAGLVCANVFKLCTDSLHGVVWESNALMKKSLQ